MSYFSFVSFCRDDESWDNREEEVGPVQVKYWAEELFYNL